MGSVGPSDSVLVGKIERLLADAKKLKDDEPSTRFELLKQVDQLQQELEPPIAGFFKQWTSLTVFTCLDIMVKLGVFEEMKTRNNVTARELGEAVKVDASVIARVMRVLVAAGIVTATGEDTYSHTPKSSIFVKGAHTAIDSFNLLTLLNKSFMTMPDYLKSRPAADLVDIRKTPYACAYGMEGKTFYEVLSANPEHLDTFNRSMSEPGPEYGMFPFSSLKAEVKAEPNLPFVVDIGGGKGQALHHIKAETDNAFGTSAKLILQERPDVLEQIKPDELNGIEPMSYDFHTEQPVKGAHIYYLCQILHNYPDHVCEDILKHVAEAMGPKSRLLIVDAVLPAQTAVGGDMAGYLIDFVGLAMGGMERTEKQFSKLLSSQGLELVKVWPGNRMYQAAVEARLKPS